MQIRKAERKQSKLRMAICGVSGSGKTLGAIRVAKGMGGKFVFIDTENGSADLYSDVADYDVLPISAPFTTEKYIKAIMMCEQSGYDIIIIDSLSHAWSGQGGILEQQGNITASSKSGNSYMAWNTVTPKHNKLIDKILQSSCHIICCMRSKSQYEVVIGANGKSAPVKIGVGPIQREGTDYEFTVAFDISRESHKYTVSKDRTRIFEEEHEFVDESVGTRLIDWLNEGKSRQETVDEFSSRILESKSLEELKDVWRDVLNENLFSTEAGELTILKDKKKVDFEGKEFADDIDM